MSDTNEQDGLILVDKEIVDKSYPIDVEASIDIDTEPIEIRQLYLSSCSCYSSSLADQAIGIDESVTLNLVDGDPFIRTFNLPPEEKVSIQEISWVKEPSFVEILNRDKKKGSIILVYSKGTPLTEIYPKDPPFRFRPLDLKEVHISSSQNTQISIVVFPKEIRG